MAVPLKEGGGEQLDQHRPVKVSSGPDNEVAGLYKVHIVGRSGEKW